MFTLLGIFLNEIFRLKGKSIFENNYFLRDFVRNYLSRSFKLRSFNLAPLSRCLFKQALLMSKKALFNFEEIFLREFIKLKSDYYVTSNLPIRLLIKGFNFSFKQYPTFPLNSPLQLSQLAISARSFNFNIPNPPWLFSGP